LRDDALIEFKRVDLGYDGKAILSRVNLSVKPGSFWGVLGPNGAGKSTFLKALLGLTPILKGERRLIRELRFGYVPQKEKLDPIYPLTAEQVVEMGTYGHWSWGQSREQTERVKQSLSECGALDLGLNRYSDLSGGQRQRVLIARALAAEPQILVLDEPLAGIDATTQKSILALLKKLHQNLNMSVVMVSHRLRSERELFTHIAWMREGKVDEGTTEEMLSNHHITEVFGDNA
jgi:ABC-type Mn2+/Zn2+ transport system ATPase subunit